MNKRVHLFIYGDVVGVGFRSWTVFAARELGLTGWVRNAFDDNVEAVFEGPQEKIEEMIRLCRQGPETAFVERVDMKWEKPTGEFVGFEIRY